MGGNLCRVSESLNHDGPRAFSPTTMRMAASVGLGVCGPLSVPRNRPQFAGQSPLVALKPAARRDLQKGGCGLVHGRLAAIPDEHDDTEDAGHAAPGPCLRRPAGLAEIGGEGRADGRCFRYLAQQENRGLGTGKFLQARNKRRQRSRRRCCRASRGAFGGNRRCQFRCLFRDPLLGRFLTGSGAGSGARGRIPDQLAEVGKAPPDFSRIKQRSSCGLGGGSVLGRCLGRSLGRITGGFLERHGSLARALRFLRERGCPLPRPGDLLLEHRRPTPRRGDFLFERRRLLARRRGLSLALCGPAFHVLVAIEGGLFMSANGAAVAKRQKKS